MWTIDAAGEVALVVVIMIAMVVACGSIDKCRRNRNGNNTDLN